MVSGTYLRSPCQQSPSSPLLAPACTEEFTLSTTVCDFIMLSAGAKYSQLQMDSVGAAICLCEVLYIAKEPEKNPTNLQIRGTSDWTLKINR